MQILQPAEAVLASGGAKPDPAVDRSIDGGRPVPIWHPLFPVDP